MKNKIEISLPEQSADRLVILSDGRPGVRSTMHVEIHEPSQEPSLSSSDGEGAGMHSECLAAEGKRGHEDTVRESTLSSTGGEEASVSDTQPILDFVSSDETLDRCGEIISAGGWRLESYRRNPVFQNAHQYGDIIFTLGRALITEVRSGSLDTRHPTLATPCLFQRIQFATEANPMARIAYALYKGKFLNAVSVGFVPLSWVDGEGEEGQGSRVEASAIRSCRRRYLEQELLEVSAVGIPANPNALQLGLKAGAIQKSDLQELLDLLRSLCASKPPHPFGDPAGSKSEAVSQLSTINSQPIFRSQSAVPNTHAGASGVRSYEAQWLRLARQVREVMRDS